MLHKYIAFSCLQTKDSSTVSRSRAVTQSRRASIFLEQRHVILLAGQTNGVPPFQEQKHHFILIVFLGTMVILFFYQERVIFYCYWGYGTRYQNENSIGSTSNLELHTTRFSKTGVFRNLKKNWMPAYMLVSLYAHTPPQQKKWGTLYPSLTYYNFKYWIYS